MFPVFFPFSRFFYSEGGLMGSAASAVNGMNGTLSDKQIRNEKKLCRFA